MIYIYEVGDLLETFDGRIRYRIREILDYDYRCDVTELDEMTHFYRLKCCACIGEKFLLKTTKRIGHEAMDKISETMIRIAEESYGIDISIREGRGQDTFKSLFGPELENEAEIRRLREENGRLLQKLSIAEKYISLAKKDMEAAEKHLRSLDESTEEED